MSDEQNTRTALDAIVRALQRGEPVTKTLIDAIPRGLRVEFEITMTGDGVSETATVLIENGTVLVFRAGERPN